MEFLEPDAKYDLEHNIYLNTHNGKVKLAPDEAIDVVYAIVDSFGLSYKILEPLEEAYAEYKEEE